MPKYTKSQVLRLRDNADRLLKKMEEREKGGDKAYDKLVVMLGGLKSKLSEAIKVPVPDMGGVIDEIRRLGDAIKKQRDFDDRGIVANLNRIEKLLSQRQKKIEVKDRTEEIIKAIKAIKIEAKDIEFPNSIAVNNFPPTKTPMPVTHISINSLSGTVHQTTTTVSTTLTTLPGYGVLDNRRSIIFYNNDSTNTVFIGGSTVTTSNGLPIEPKSFSPSFDSGPLQKWYGVTSSGTADIRTIEVPDENAGR